MLCLQKSSAWAYRLLWNCACSGGRELCRRNVSDDCNPLTVFPPGRLTSLQDCFAQETPGGGGNQKVCPSQCQVTPSTRTDESPHLLTTRHIISLAIFFLLHPRLSLKVQHVTGLKRETLLYNATSHCHS